MPASEENHATVASQDSPGLLFANPRPYIYCNVTVSQRVGGICNFRLTDLSILGALSCAVGF